MGFIVILILCVIILPIVIGIANGTSKKHEYMEARNTIEEKLKEQGFNIEKQVGLTAKLYVDNTQKLWAINEWDNNTDVTIYKYSDLIDFELLEDDESLMKGGFGKALVGGAIGGTTGAVIGSAGSRKFKQNATLLEIKIRTNDFNHPQYSIQFIKGFALPKNSPAYKEYFDAAQEVIGVLNYIATNGEEKQIQANSSTMPNESIGDKLRELNQLKNEGIITAEEFEVKKKEILNL